MEIPVSTGIFFLLGLVVLPGLMVLVRALPWLFTVFLSLAVAREFFHSPTSAVGCLPIVYSLSSKFVTSSSSVVYKFLVWVNHLPS
jgi:hypothetical protein